MYGLSYSSTGNLSDNKIVLVCYTGEVDLKFETGTENYKKVIIVIRVSRVKYQLGLQGILYKGF